VVEFRKKIFLFLMMVALGAGVLVICSAQSTTAGIESEKSQPDPNDK